jgi:acylphosphatase
VTQDDVTQDDVTHDADASPVARRLEVDGRVQGVFFRASARDEAVRLGVTGWVRNRPDGSVEVWAEGDASAVADLEAWVGGGGPTHARVDEVVATSVAPEGHDRFEVRGD